jgi:preprotein translocase subunit SecE
MENLGLIIGLVIGVVVFAIFWRKGFFLRTTNYIQETREELKKCTWPNREELKGSTVVVLVAIALLGAFTVAVDFVIIRIINLIT